MEPDQWPTRRPVPDLPPPNRSKRTRPSNQDLDVELDNYFRSKRFMTESVAKEMEDVTISEPTITTSPSRTSTLTRYGFTSMNPPPNHLSHPFLIFFPPLLQSN
jgi:hypothetical protein